MNTPREPGPPESGIDQLVSALTADGDLDELTSALMSEHQAAQLAALGEALV